LVYYKMDEMFNQFSVCMLRMYQFNIYSVYVYL